MWLRHPYRMLCVNMNDLVARERDSKDNGNSFTLTGMPYIEYRTLAPVQDCKMPVLIEVNPIERTFQPMTEFVLDREEFQRIVSTVRSVRSLL